MISKLSYCGALVREHDPDRFLLSLFVPARFRADLWVLFAFYYEIAKTREVVSETQLGLIRLQWWRDEISRIYEGDEVVAHEILVPLAEIIYRYGLSREYFEALIYAREFDLEDVSPTHLEGTLNYADFTTTPLLKLVLQIMGEEPEGGEAVQPVAINYALMGILRSVPYLACSKRCLLPESLMAQHRVRKLYDLKPEGGLKAVVRELVAQLICELKPGNKFLKASHKLSLVYRQQLQACDYDVFSPAMGHAPALKELRLWFSMVF